MNLANEEYVKAVSRASEFSGSCLETIEKKLIGSLGYTQRICIRRFRRF